MKVARQYRGLPDNILKARACALSGKMKEAADRYIAQVDHEPTNAGLLQEVAAFCVKVKDFGLGGELAARAALLSPEHQTAELWHLLGICFVHSQDFYQAEQCAIRAFQKDPKHILSYASSAVLAMQAGDRALAKERFTLAITKKARTQHERFIQGDIRALFGDYDQSWTLREARRFVPEMWAIDRPDNMIPLWSGEPLRGKPLLLVGEGGLGDEIMFARFLPPLLAMVDGPVTYAVKRANMPLFALYPGLAHVVCRDEPDWTVFGHQAKQVRIFSLPLALGMRTPDTWPAPDFQLPPSLPRWTNPARPTNQSPVIGFCYFGAKEHENDFDRSCPTPDTMREPLEHAFGPFQRPSMRPSQNPLTSPGLTMQHFGPLRDFTYGIPMSAAGMSWTDTAKALLDIDALLTVDTALAHFAAALGVPTVVIVAAASEWRWGFDLENPWYPHAIQLVQKPHIGEGAWEQAIGEAINKLRALTS